MYDSFAKGDPLGGMEVTPAGFGHLTKILCEISNKVVLVLEGGYELEVISASAAACISVLLGDPPEELELEEVLPEAKKTIETVKNIQKRFWSCFQEDTDSKVPSSNDTHTPTLQ